MCVYFASTNRPCFVEKQASTSARLYPEGEGESGKGADVPGGLPVTCIWGARFTSERLHPFKDHVTGKATYRYHGRRVFRKLPGHRIIVPTEQGLRVKTERAMEE